MKKFYNASSIPTFGGRYLFRESNEASYFTGNNLLICFHDVYKSNEAFFIRAVEVDGEKC